MNIEVSVCRVCVDLNMIAYICILYYLIMLTKILTILSSKAKISSVSLIPTLWTFHLWQGSMLNILIIIQIMHKRHILHFSIGTIGIVINPEVEIDLLWLYSRTKVYFNISKEDILKHACRVSTLKRTPYQILVTE